MHKMRQMAKDANPRKLGKVRNNNLRNRLRKLVLAKNRHTYNKGKHKNLT